MDKKLLIFIVVTGLVIITFCIVPSKKKIPSIQEAFQTIANLKTLEAEATRIVMARDSSILGSSYYVKEFYLKIETGFDLTKAKFQEANGQINITIPEEINYTFNFLPEKSKVLFLDSTGLARNFSPRRRFEEEREGQLRIENEFKQGDSLKEETKNNLKIKAAILEGILQKKVNFSFDHK